MQTTTTFLKGLCVAVVVTNGCVSHEDGSAKVTVATNALGITALETNQTEASGNKVFTLQAFSADDQLLASVQMTIGVVSGLPTVGKPDAAWQNRGSEIILTVGTDQQRTISREVKRHPLMHSIPTIQRFLDVPEVASTLEHEANILVTKTPSPRSASSETAYDYVCGEGWCDSEDGETATNCPADCSPIVSCTPDLLMTSPTATQCCYYQESPYNPETLFVNAASPHVAINREQNPSGYGCQAEDSFSTCSGSACYFGPFGFAAAQMSDFTQAPYAPGYSWPLVSNDYNGGCFAAEEMTQLPESYSDVTGTNPRGYSCCDDGTGPCADQAACDACGGGNSGFGYWDY
jgi:hypothetical protein